MIQKIIQYRCDCGYTVKEEFTGIFSGTCGKCGNTVREYKITYNPKSKGEGFKANICYAENERWSRSMGVPPAQIKEYEAMFPGSEYNSHGDLRIKNYSHREFERRRRGMVDLGNRK